jgi:hypothetical protein
MSSRHSTMQANLYIMGLGYWELDLPSKLAFPRVWVCTGCGRQWAHLSIPKGDWTVWSYPMPCIKCKTDPTYPIQCFPGSLLHQKPWPPYNYDQDLLNALPLELLHREFTIHEREGQLQTA